MKLRITHLAPLTPALMLALATLLVSLILLAINLAPVLAVPGPRLRFLNPGMLALPVAHAAFGFVAGLVLVGLFNLMARAFGGIVITLAPVAQTQAQAQDQSEMDTQPAPQPMAA